MKFKNKILLILILIFSHAAYALDMKDIVAYPVPFNPHVNKTLTVGYPGGASLAGYKINVSICDINGDVVITRSRAQVPLVWNGRNGSGRFVKPGLYILKVEIENDLGDYGKKVIRVLIDY